MGSVFYRLQLSVMVVCGIVIWRDAVAVAVAGLMIGLVGGFHSFSLLSLDTCV